MTVAPEAPIRLTLRNGAAIIAAGALVLASAIPAPAIELFGRKFFERDSDAAVVPDAQPYTLEFNVTGGDKALVKAIRNASVLAREEERPPPGTAGLIARARGDYGRILAALYAAGHYGGTVRILVGDAPVESLRPDVALPDPVAVSVVADPGPLFHFGAVSIEGAPPAPMTEEDADALDLDDWELATGLVARSGAVLEAEGRLVEVWRQRGHPTARIAKRDIVADHRTGTVDVALVVDRGPSASFGHVDITGAERMDPAYVRWMTGLEPGKEYDPDEIRRSRDRLQRLGVFASVAFVEADNVGDDGLLPIYVNLSERKRRLIGGGVTYSTLDGATLEGYWMHRNLFGHAESLRFDASVSRIFADGFDWDLSYGLATTFRRPGIFTPDTDMTLRLEAEREFVDTYESDTIAGKAGLEHRFNERLTGKTALNAEWANIDDAFGTNRYLIASLPSQLDYDSRDNKLDPTEGLRGTLDAEPLAEFEGGTLALVARGTLSGYLAVADDERMVIAARGSLGSIVGGSLEDIPATRRFYLGGGGSIRGYEYRSIGPERNGEVVGGLSFWEGSAEFRYRVTDAVGIVPFIDAGAAYEESIPDFSEGIRVGAGIGIRYYTPLGPLRFDVAVPLNPDSGDPEVAFYVGLGQAF